MIGIQYLTCYGNSEAKKLRKKEKKMCDYEYIYSGGPWTDNEGRTTDASYAKNILEKFSFQNWNQFWSKMVPSQFPPHHEKNTFFFYIQTICHVSTKVLEKFPTCESSCLDHISSPYKYGRDNSNSFGLVTCTLQNRFSHTDRKIMMFQCCWLDDMQQQLF